MQWHKDSMMKQNLIFCTASFWSRVRWNLVRNGRQGKLNIIVVFFWQAQGSLGIFDLIHNMIGSCLTFAKTFSASVYKTKCLYISGWTGFCPFGVYSSNHLFYNPPLVYFTEAQMLLHLLNNISPLLGLHATKSFRDLLFLKGKQPNLLLTN